MTSADAIAREIEAIAHDAERIQALSRVQPHIFAEQKDAIARRLRKLSCELRNTFGGTPAATTLRSLTPGRRTLPRGRVVRVEIRKARTA